MLDSPGHIQRTLNLYRSFDELPWRIRLRAAGALVLFYALLLVLTHLTFDGHVERRAYERIMLLAFVTWLSLPLLGLRILLQPPRSITAAAFSAWAVAAVLTGLLMGYQLGLTIEDPSDFWSYLGDFRPLRQTPLRPLLWFIGVFCVGFGIRLTLQSARALFRDKAQRDQEIGLAREIQSRLLPPLHLRTDAYVIMGCSRLAQEVGGDYFDAVELPDDKVAFAIGDIAGHGVGAGLLTAMLKSAFLTELTHALAPDAVASSLNRLLYAHASRRMFATFCCGVLDVRDGRLLVVNAGHLPLLHHCQVSGEVRRLNPQGIGLGLVEDATFEVCETKLAAGDTVALVSDGLTEVFDRAHQEFGLEGVERCLHRDRNARLEDISDRLFDAARAYGDGAAFRDDATVLLLRWHPDGLMDASASSEQRSADVSEAAEPLFDAA